MKAKLGEEFTLTRTAGRTYYRALLRTDNKEAKEKALRIQGRCKEINKDRSFLHDEVAFLIDDAIIARLDKRLNLAEEALEEAGRKIRDSQISPLLRIEWELESARLTLLMKIPNNKVHRKNRKKIKVQMKLLISECKKRGLKLYLCKAYLIHVEACGAEDWIRERFLMEAEEIIDECRYEMRRKDLEILFEGKSPSKPNFNCF